MACPTIDFIHTVVWSDIPEPTQAMARQCLLDLLGVAASGTQTELSRLINHHAIEHFAKSQTSPGSGLLFDGRVCSPLGAALANGMTIDSIDAHDGYKPSKGHAGCGVLAGLLSLVGNEADSTDITEEELLTCLVIGYEIACRAGVALHQSTPDYHTSGAWVAIATAAIGARILNLTTEQTREALGIAEYHGPRSQMMRCIDHPTMLKDGSGWGAMAGVSAAYLAQSGFTGAPAITIEEQPQAQLFNDLGSRWLIMEQYFKPYPVCRWAQPAVVAAMKLQAEHKFGINDIAKLSIGTFHESWRLATAAPANTEEAQYSLPFPVAAALSAGCLTVKEIDGDGLRDQTVIALSQSIELYEVEAYNESFPAQRISEVTISLKDGRVLTSGATEADGDPETPLHLDEIKTKFQLFASPVIGDERSDAIIDHVLNMAKNNQSLSDLNSLIYSPGVG